jgi:hypothetical protein
MLSQPQIEKLWECKMSAEARAFYFADIANRESGIKRWITGVTFVISSAVVVTLLSKVPNWISVAMALSIAVANGYQIAVGQDSKIKTAGKLHMGWLKLEHDYDRLWSHTSDAEAESDLDKLLDHERDLSETAATELGHDDERWSRWMDIVHKKYETDGHDHRRGSE